MAYFAELDSNNIVLRTIKLNNTDAPDPAPNVSEPQGLDFIHNTLGLHGVWKQTSYNSRGGVHYQANSWIPSGHPHMRFNFATPGCTYDPIRDAFIPPKPHDDAYLDESTCLWVILSD